MKIKKLQIESFRGIPNQLSVNFTDKKGTPCSTLIYGDNGSGKSSIVDALEYNLQGRIERSSGLKNPFRPSPINWKNEQLKGAFTICHFEDDTINKRDIIISYDSEKESTKFEKTNSALHTNFNIAPFVLRRSDIINYATTPAQKKQILFWSFIYGGQFSPSDDAPDKAKIQNLEDEKISLKRQRDKIKEDLAGILNLYASEIPSTRNELDSFIKNKIRNGLSAHQYRSLKRKGVVRGISEEALTLSGRLKRKIESLKQLQSKIARIRQIGSTSNESRKSETRRFLTEASEHLTEAFLMTSTTDFVENITFKISELTEVSFEIVVELKNGSKTSPNRIFSEANLDLLILLLYTSLIKESEKYGQAKLLVLDDVLQSVDSTIRLNFIDYLLKSFKDWQIIISAHDRLWLNQIRNAFSRNNHKFKEVEIFRWDFNDGPQIIEQDILHYNSALSAALDSKNIQLIASQTGLLLERICQNLSMTLNTSISRRFKDRYTIGDLWPGIKKYFKKSSIHDTLESIDKTLYIRNLAGAHYNEWAASLSNSEIIGFAENVNALFHSVYCLNCHSWIKKTNNCNCGKLSSKDI